MHEKIEEKKEEIQEKKMNYKIEATERSIEYDIAKAELRIEDIVDDALLEIDAVVYSTYTELEKGEKPVDYIKYKADNLLTEVSLKATLRMQQVKNMLMRSLENDVGKLTEFIDSEVEKEHVKEQINAAKLELNEKIYTRKNEITQKIENIKK